MTVQEAQPAEVVSHVVRNASKYQALLVLVGLAVSIAVNYKLVDYRVEQLETRMSTLESDKKVQGEKWDAWREDMKAQMASVVAHEQDQASSLQHIEDKVDRLKP